MVERQADALRAHAARSTSTRARVDEFFLDLGAEAFRTELERIGVTDVFFELFDGKHGGIVWRYPMALRYLAERRRRADARSRSARCAEKEALEGSPTVTQTTSSALRASVRPRVA